MTSPFDNEQESFYALVNADGQHSLWPEFARVPDGWAVAYGAGPRAQCLEYIEKTWKDLRPGSPDGARDEVSAS